MNEKLFLSIATLLGAIIGAGIFTLPFGVSRAGVFPSLFYFLILGAATLFINLFLGEVVLRTEKKQRLVGLAKIYLEKKGEILITLSVILGTIGTLLAYIIMGGEFLRTLFFPFFEISSFPLSFFFWLILSIFVFRGIKIIAKTEFFTNLVFFLIIFLILIFGIPKFKFENLSILNRSEIFLPYGLILFAFTGASGVLEISEILKTPKERKDFKKAVISSQIIVFLFYVLFAFLIAGVSGDNTSKEALFGLVPYLGQKIIFLGALAATITLADSFLVMGLYLRNTLIYDYNFSKFLATCFSCGIPFFLFLLGFKDFIEVIGFVGAVAGAVEGILIILIFQKAKKIGKRDPEYQIKVPAFLIYILMLIFIVGAILEIVY